MQGFPECGWNSKIFAHFGKNTLFLPGQEYPHPRNEKLARSWHFWVLTTTEYPPHWNLGRSWHFEFWLLQNMPPHWNWQILALRVLTTTEYHPPWKLKFRQILAPWVLTTTEYTSPKLKFRQILALWVLSTIESPPHWNLDRSWHFEFWLLQNPPQLKFRQILVPFQDGVGICGD